jgi:hypothetical protein
MADSALPKRKTIRTGLGILLLVLGGYSIYTTLAPSPGMARASTYGELVVMLLVGAALAGGGAIMIIAGTRRQRSKLEDPY